MCVCVCMWTLFRPPRDCCQQRNTPQPMCLHFVNLFSGSGRKWCLSSLPESQRCDRIRTSRAESLKPQTGAQWGVSLTGQILKHLHEMFFRLCIYSSFRKALLQFKRHDYSPHLSRFLLWLFFCIFSSSTSVCFFSFISAFSPPSAFVSPTNAAPE